MQCKMMTTLLNPAPKYTFCTLANKAWWQLPLYRRAFWDIYLYIYICALWSLNRTTGKNKKLLKNGVQNWLPLAEVSPDQRVPYLICLFCLKTFSVLIYIVRSKQSLCGGGDLRSPVLSLVLLPPRLDCDLRWLLFQSTDLQTHRAWGISKLCGTSLPCVTETSPFPLVVFPLSVCLEPSRLRLFWLCVMPFSFGSHVCVHV